MPFDKGRPAPSWIVNFAVKSCAPYRISWFKGVLNSSPSCKCLGIATSRPIRAPGLCPDATVTKANADKATTD